MLLTLLVPCWISIIKVDIYKNNSVLESKSFANVLNSVKIDLERVKLEGGDTINVKVTFEKQQTCGIMVPARTYFRADVYGSEMAMRQADFFYNTLANTVFYSGVEMRLQKDETNKTTIVTDTWNN